MKNLIIASLMAVIFYGCKKDSPQPQTNSVTTTPKNSFIPPDTIYAYGSFILRTPLSNYNGNVSGAAFPYATFSGKDRFFLWSTNMGVRYTSCSQINNMYPPSSAAILYYVDSNYILKSVWFQKAADTNYNPNGWQLNYVTGVWLSQDTLLYYGASNTMILDEWGSPNTTPFPSWDTVRYSGMNYANGMESGSYYQELQNYNGWYDNEYDNLSQRNATAYTGGSVHLNDSLEKVFSTNSFSLPNLPIVNIRYLYVRK